MLSSQKHIKTTAPRLMVVTMLFVLALMVLGFLSLRQHRQLQELRSSYRHEVLTRTQKTKLLMNQLVSLRNNFDNQIEIELGKRLQNISAEPTKNSQQELLKLKQCLQELSEKVAGFTGHGQLEQLTAQIDRSQQQVAELIDSFHQTEQLVAQAAGAVCLIQGEYMFVDPKTEEPLRYIEPEITEHNGFEANGSTRKEKKLAADILPVSVSGKGSPLMVQYTGTGFLADERGYILTNKHVVAPWEVSLEYRHVLEAGYEPRMCLLRAFFPDHEQGFDLTVAAQAQNEDVALLYCGKVEAKIEPLVCEEDPQQLKMGQTVIILGYPTGFDALLARLEAEQMERIIGVEGVSFEQMAQNMARRHLIQPTGTRGMCGRVTDNKIVYDAQTAIGGSGAPVLGVNGKVVGINTALLKGFAGTNFGIPISSALKLLRRTAQPKKVQTAQIGGPAKKL